MGVKKDVRMVGGITTAIIKPAVNLSSTLISTFYSILQLTKVEYHY